ncbi:signal recognition particle receptor subunit alpha isoform X1 [Cygnus atratus]|uniref:signal recognition particle receptor subunit alpha isoform X1 n=1 Tax=Cygnus atratus TaxID=8868 RepID=UPI0015D5D004|nr:signal recognition particle receptor subunit alpha isoform X1 [Cygnus atratus]
MLDFFTIFSKGGLVLWCFQGVRGPAAAATAPVNALIRSVLLQERGGSNSFTHEALTLKYKLDNQFELVFVVGFQKILTLTYVDKLIDDVHKEFRDKYRNEFQQKGALGLLNGTFDFKDDFLRLLREAEESSKVRAPTVMKTFEQSVKSQKTVKCMIETRGEKPKEKVKTKKNKGSKKEGAETVTASNKAAPGEKQPSSAGDREELTKDEILQKNREEFFKRHMKAGEKSSKSPKPDAQKEKGKKPRVWDLGNSNAKVLDYSDSTTNGNSEACPVEEFDPDVALGDRNREPGRLYDLEYESDEEAEEEKVIQNTSKPSTKKGGLGGMFGMLKGLVGSKSLTREDMDPVLEKMKDHLIAKNVAAEIAVQLCESVAKKLEGKVMGTFTTVTSTVKQALQEALVQILQPQRRVDVLRDVMDAQRHRRPYVVTFCGVNGVGKSTNLAKISFWLIENGFSVLIAACDTFRAGAVEQLRTHTRRLNALHPPESHGGRTMVQLYEKGYGKDAAGIAMEAISYARNQGFDVVLVDTAGRMQDNAPLMTALAKLIAVNAPDLVLFVGEALVGNEAVDQLVSAESFPAGQMGAEGVCRFCWRSRGQRQHHKRVSWMRSLPQVKFNKALADHSMAQTPRLIDGIVLTKFDTIDDKVGAAISMTYITSKPIVFVGTGQTYCDLRSLNAKAVVAALMKA